MKKVFLLTIIFLSSCTLNKVVQHHGIHNLELKQTKLIINQTNKNDIIKLIGPPSTKGAFDNDIYIFLERKTSGSKLTKIGKKNLIKNNILVLEIDKRGVLIDKKFYNKDDMNDLVFDKKITNIDYTKKSFINNFLSSVSQQIDDPFGKKRIKN